LFIVEASCTFSCPVWDVCVVLLLLLLLLLVCLLLLLLLLLFLLLGLGLVCLVQLICLMKGEESTYSWACEQILRI
jgi:hypothetical protein